MRSLVHISALALMAAAFIGPVAAQSTPAPPEWEDGVGTSVYDTAAKRAAVDEPRELTVPDPAAPILSSPPVATPAVSETHVVQAVHHAPVSTATKTDSRRLAPPRSARAQGAARIGGTANGTSISEKMPSFGLPTQTILTIASALAIVVGGFLVFAWCLRRGGRRGTAVLPSDVVSVLGRVPLAARQFAELLRVGNKLVLVSMTPAGAEPITEVTDPVEVDRLVGLCQQANPHSTTKAFEHVFRQLSRETAPTGFLGDASLPPTLSAAAEAYRAHRGEAGRG